MTRLEKTITDLEKQRDDLRREVEQAYTDVLKMNREISAFEGKADEKTREADVLKMQLQVAKGEVEENKNDMIKREEAINKVLEHQRLATQSWAEECANL